MRSQLKKALESWRTGPRHKGWSGPANKEKRNEYNGLMQVDVIDRHPLIFEPRNTPAWTFEYNMKWPANMQTAHWREAGESLEWLSPDSHHKFVANCANPDMKELLEANGWLDNKFMYHINEDGLRYDGSSSESSVMESQGGVLYLGCSITFGIGVALEQTWSHQLHQRVFPDKRYMNFGQPGHGVDTYYRVLKSYISIVKPDIVICTYPWASGRAEIFNPNQTYWHNHFMSAAVGHMQITMTDGHSEPDAFTRMSQFSPEPSMIRYMKNHDAIKCLCQENDAHLLWLNIQQMSELVSETRTNLHDPGRFVPEWDFGRDCMHHGPKGHEAMSYKIEEELKKCSWWKN